MSERKGAAACCESVGRDVVVVQPQRDSRACRWSRAAVGKTCIGGWSNSMDRTLGEEKHGQKPVLVDECARFTTSGPLVCARRLGWACERVRLNKKT